MTHDTALGLFREVAVHAPLSPAIAYFDNVLSYGDIDQYSDSFAAWLRRAGVGRGDRVCIRLQNVPQAVIGFVAAWKVGAIVMPCNPMYKEGELAKLFADAEPRVVLCETEGAATVREALVRVGLDATVITTHDRDLQSRNDPRVFANAEARNSSEFLRFLETPADGVTDVTLAPDDLGLLLYTSGTTGSPKGVMLRHSGLAFNARASRDSFRLGPNSIILGLAPLFHIIGVVCDVLGAFAAGSSLVLGYRFHPEVVLDTIRERRPTAAIAAITAFTALLRNPAATREDLASFESIYSGGAPVPPAIRAEFATRFGKSIYTAYGMTELSSPAHFCPLGVEPRIEAESGTVSVGLPVAGTSAKVIDEEGADAGPGIAGELLIKGPHVMAGYWNKEDETRTALAGGWMHTGDVAIIDADGWCYIVDRKKDMIIASGFKVWPRETEDVLYTLEGVREVVVVGKPDAYRGETVKAYVSLKDGVTLAEEAIVSHARAHLAAYKCPHEVEILDDLPKTDTGKLSRAILRQRAARDISLDDAGNAVAGTGA